MDLACRWDLLGMRPVPGGLLLLRSFGTPPPIHTLSLHTLLPSPHFGAGPGGGGGGVRVWPLPFHAYSRMKMPSMWVVTTSSVE